MCLLRAMFANTFAAIRFNSDPGVVYGHYKLTDSVKELAPTSRTNGKAERFIRTLLNEWAYAQAYRNSLARTHALRHYLGYYNTARPHMGIHGLTPRQKLATL